MARWGLLLLSWLLIGLVTVLLLRWLAAWRLRRLRVQMGIEIRNLGNARSTYELTIQDPTDLKFAFAAPDGTRLNEMEYEEQIEKPVPASQAGKSSHPGRSLPGRFRCRGARPLDRQLARQRVLRTRQHSAPRHQQHLQHRRQHHGRRRVESRQGGAGATRGRAACRVLPPTRPIFGTHGSIRTRPGRANRRRPP